MSRSKADKPTFKIVIEDVFDLPPVEVRVSFAAPASWALEDPRMAWPDWLINDLMELLKANLMPELACAFAVAYLKATAQHTEQLVQQVKDGSYVKASLGEGEPTKLQSFAIMPDLNKTIEKMRKLVRAAGPKARRRDVDPEAVMSHEDTLWREYEAEGVPAPREKAKAATRNKYDFGEEAYESLRREARAARAIARLREQEEEAKSSP